MKKIKKLINTILMVGMILSLSACGGNKVAIDYADAESFEAALNNGKNLEGKVIQFVAGELNPDSVFGYDIFAGEHLNFVSSSHPNTKEGDTVVVKATKIESVMGSWIITYDKVSDAVITESTISSSGAEHKVDTSTSTEVVNENKERTQKDGFDENTNSIVNMSTFSISVPQYWDADIKESNSFRAYAEKSGKVAMLQIFSSYDNEDPVTFEILKEETDNGKMASAMESWYDSCGEVESGIFDNGHVKGYIYKCTYTQEGYSGNTMCLCLPSVDDNNWVYVLLMETDNTDYLYDSDYIKILNSIEATKEEDVEVSPDGKKEDTEEITNTENIEDEIAVQEKQEVEEETKGVFDFACIRELSEYDMYILIDTDTNKAVNITTTETSALEGTCSGDEKSGFTIRYNNVWVEKLKISGSRVILIDMNGFEWDYKKCDVNDAEKFYNKQIKSTFTEPDY